MNFYRMLTINNDNTIKKLKIEKRGNRQKLYYGYE